jgi:hypothetical protein
MTSTQSITGRRQLLAQTASLSLLAFGGGVGSFPAVAGQTILVASYNQLAAAVAVVGPGDEILLASGTYSGNRLVVAGNGSADAPIVIRSVELLGANVPNGFDLVGSEIRLVGIDFQAAHPISPLLLGGTGNQAWRCRFASLGGTHVVFTTGTGGRLMYCEFSSLEPSDDWQPDMFAIRTHINDASRHYNGEIGHCYFHDLPRKPAGEPYSTRARNAIGLGNGNNAALLELKFHVHHCLFQNCGNCRLSVNSSNNLIEYCMITGKTGSDVTYSTDFSVRYGKNNVFRGCSTENAEGFLLFGAGHRLISCRTRNSSRTNIAPGDATDPAGLMYPRADGCKLTACEMPVRVGGPSFPGPLPAKDTRLEAHIGSVELVDDLQVGTMQTAQLTETPVTPVAITPAMVGPRSGL